MMLGCGVSLGAIIDDNKDKSPRSTICHLKHLKSNKTSLKQSDVLKYSIY